MATPPNTWLLEEPIRLVHADGRIVETSLKLGVPIPIFPKGGARKQDNHDSHCWVQLEGLVEMEGPIVAGSTLDVLVSALAHVGNELRGFVARGGEVLDAGGNATTIPALLGPLFSAHVS